MPRYEFVWEEKHSAVVYADTIEEADTLWEDGNYPSEDVEMTYKEIFDMEEDNAQVDG